MEAFLELPWMKRLKGLETTLYKAKNLLANYVLQLGLEDTIYQRIEPWLVSRARALLREWRWPTSMVQDNDRKHFQNGLLDSSGNGRVSKRQRWDCSAQPARRKIDVTPVKGGKVRVAAKEAWYSGNSGKASWNLAWLRWARRVVNDDLWRPKKGGVGCQQCNGQSEGWSSCPIKKITVHRTGLHLPSF